jgi:hypothetical protein
MVLVMCIPFKTTTVVAGSVVCQVRPWPTLMAVKLDRAGESRRRRRTRQEQVDL